MCGIVGAVAQRDVADILVEGLKRLEYRGYDSAGVAIINSDNQLKRARRLGKVQELADALHATSISRRYRYCSYSLGDPWCSK